jgi:hypothetical protein
VGGQRGLVAMVHGLGDLEVLLGLLSQVVASIPAALLA